MRVWKSSSSFYNFFYIYYAEFFCKFRNNNLSFFRWDCKEKFASKYKKIKFPENCTMRHQLIFSSIFTCLCLEIVSPTNLCSTAGLCCKHRDSECVAQKVFPNHTVDTSQLPCYCDHACIKLDDCCSDYKHFCSGKLLKPLFKRCSSEKPS